jgi:hypothetical protein
MPEHEVEKVDIPIEVPKEMAEEMAEELDETGSIHINVTERNAPSLTEQIRWQLENDQQLLQFVEDYDAE